jgi:hypothetical protein
MISHRCQGAPEPELSAAAAETSVLVALVLALVPPLPPPPLAELWCAEGLDLPSWLRPRAAAGQQQRASSLMLLVLQVYKRL